MDKKLILNIENIEYISKKSEVNNSIEDIKKNLDLLPQVLKFFQRIKINKLKIDNNEFEIVLDENNIYLDNKFINLSSRMTILSNQIVFDLYSLYLKDNELLFDGKVKVDYFNEKINYFGDAYYLDLQTHLNVEMNKKIAKFYLSSESFKNLRFLKKFLDLPEIAESWMYDNVQGEMKLNEFYGEFDLEKNQIIEKSLEGKAQIIGAKIRFHEKVDVINTKSLDVSFKDDKLHFDLIEPRFKGKNIDGSFVTIFNLTSLEKGRVDVNIKTVDKLDKDILDILKAYEINLPIVQKSGLTNASLLLKFPYEESKKMETIGEFLINDAEILLNNFSFHSKNAQVLLKDTNIEIKNADFKHKNMIDATVNLNLDTKTLKASGDALIKSFLIEKEDKEKIVHIQNINTPIFLDFNKEVIIELKKLEADIKISDLVYVNIPNLSKIYPYSKLLNDISAKNGNLFLAIKDEKNITFNAFLQGLSFPIEKENIPLDNLEIQGNISENKTTISSLDSNIRLEIDEEFKIFLKDLNVNIDTEKQRDNLNRKMSIYLQNSKLKIDDSVYDLKSANIFLNNRQINFEANVINLDLPIKKDNKEIKELEIIGTYNEEFTSLNTLNKDIFLKLKKDSISLNIDGYDIYFYSKDIKNSNKYKNIDVVANKSNVIIDDKYKILADNYEVRLRDESKFLYLKHKDTNITFKESEDKKVDIFAHDINSEFLNSILNKNVLKDGSIMFLASGSLDDLSGKIIIEDSNIEDLAILNNILIFIHTSPVFINPLFAIPTFVGMATNSGFNLTGYRVVDGTVEFNYNKKDNLLDIKKILTLGNGIDFDGKGQINLKDLTITSDLKLIFLKDYSKIVGVIPFFNYFLLGDNNRVETEVNIMGELNNPSISTNLTKDAFNAPLNITKRIFTLPSMLFDFIMEKEDLDKKEELINKPL